MDKLRIVVGGYIGLYPTGGASWDYMQYPLGLQNLGHDVYYIEDTMQYPVFQEAGKAWDDASACVQYLHYIMTLCGMEEKWAYRDIASGRCFGMDEKHLQQVITTADVFINISCSTFLRDEYLKIPKRILIDSDPMFTQIQYELEMLNTQGSASWSTKYMLENHNYLFTFGENIGQPDCLIPPVNCKWLTTRQPICLDRWMNTVHRTHKAFTTIMNWSGRKKLVYQNQEWGQKDVEFEKYSTIASKFVKGTFKGVINPPLNAESSYDLERLQHLGWTVLHPQCTVARPDEYQKFIFRSLAEFSVAKETYVKSNSGWFSCRSACYLAAGKPVVTQETGWSKFIPAGYGLHAFNDPESAVKGVEQVISQSKNESKAAREIAQEYFGSSKVLSTMLAQVN